jgi:hypothetical protein
MREQGTGKDPEEAVMAYLKALFHNSPEETEGEEIKKQSKYLHSRLSFFYS